MGDHHKLSKVSDEFSAITKQMETKIKFMYVLFVKVQLQKIINIIFIHFYSNNC